MIAEDFVTDTVQANDEAIIEWLWGRAFLLDEALNRESPKTLPSPNLDDPEEKWQCNPDYCSYHDLCEKSKMECDKVE